VQVVADSNTDDTPREARCFARQQLAEGPLQQLAEGPLQQLAEGPLQQLAEGPLQQLAEGPLQQLAEGPLQQLAERPLQLVPVAPLVMVRVVLRLSHPQVRHFYFCFPIVFLWSIPVSRTSSPSSADFETKS
jgi:hypothetical protein